ncbi:hypothetical protein FGO68_gene109 [Halteria grandinella]|uniref:Uncharacterized protein n=1 Tax=Halteria grandinella TaxID=5974 RepID=A0A8J8SVD1_HALGN|nr:hypothetical protein FGO68_gene109 [Halteria grandinella]
MLFTCLAYFAFGLMFAYQEVLKETRTVMYKNKLNFREDNPPLMLPLLPTYTLAQYRMQMAIKYLRILGTMLFITIGLALYSLRRIRIIRAVGNLKNEDVFRVVYKRVYDFQVSRESNKQQQHHLLDKRNKISGDLGNKAIESDDDDEDEQSIRMHQETMVLQTKGAKQL